jgi:hypothetical protein
MLARSYAPLEVIVVDDDLQKQTANSVAAKLAQMSDRSKL